MLPNSIRRKGVEEDNRQYCYFAGNGKFSLGGGSVNLGTTSMINLWIYRVDVTVTQRPIGEGTYLGDYLLSLFNGGTGIRIAEFYDGTYGNTGAVNNEWSNLVIVRNGNDIDLYVNGSFLSTKAGYGVVENTLFDTIGSAQNNTSYLTGGLDRVAGFDSNGTPAKYVATVPSQISFLYGRGTPQTSGDPTKLTGCKICFDFEKSGVDAYDSSGNENTGTSNGNPTKMKY